MATERGSGQDAGHRALDVETYRWKTKWKRNDFAIVAAAVPVLVSIGWQTGQWTGLGVGLLASAMMVALIFLLEFWLVQVYCFMRLDREKDHQKAQVAVVKPKHAHNGNRSYKCTIEKRKSTAPPPSSSSPTPTFEVYFDFWNARYVYNEDSRMFDRLIFEVEGTPFSQHFKASGYLSSKKAEQALEKWGTNEFTFYKPEFLPLLVEHMLAPFFVFQLFCVGLWCLDEYWYYSLFTLFMLVLFECTVVNQRLRNLSTLQQMGHQPQFIWALREEKWVNINEQFLLPGDIISISSQSGMYLANAVWNNDKQHGTDSVHRSLSLSLSLFVFFIRFFRNVCASRLFASFWYRHHERVHSYR
jgi:hypothetical protein